MARRCRTTRSTITAARSSPICSACRIARICSMRSCIRSRSKSGLRRRAGSELAGGSMIRSRRKTIAIAIVVALSMGTHLARAQAAADRRAITFRDLIAMHRLSDPQISPDGQWVSYSIATPDYDANHLVKNIWIVAVAGGEPRQLTQGGSDERGRWSPDSKKIAYVSAVDGTAQVFTISVEGGSPIRVTSLSGGADNVLWSPDGAWIEL